MSKKLILVVAMLLAVSVLAFGCGGGGGGGGTDDDIVIGVLAPTTGPEAYYGTDIVRSYQLAVDEINEAGGVLGRNLVLKQEDDGCDPNMASTAGNKIVSLDPDFVAGGYCSGATIPALQAFYDAQKIMLVSNANSTNITDMALEQTFMINSPGTHAIANLIELIQSLGYTKVAVIHQGDDYTKNLSDICDREMPGAGLQIVTTEVMEKGAADVSAIVTAVRNAGAEFVYWCGYHADGSNVIKQLRQGGYTGEICVGDGSVSVELITACGAAGEGVYATSPPFVEFAENGEAYIAKFNEKYGEDPGTYSTLSYDTIYVLKTAIEKAGSTDYEAVRDAIQNIEYQGLSGLIKFADNRELALSNFIILQIHDGAFQLIEL